jgi:two-component system CheB/CheR fusion protein
MTTSFISDQAADSRWKLLSVAQDRLARAEDLNEIIAIVRNSARAMCSADGVTFVLRDGDKCHYVEEEAIGPLWKGQKFPMATCISGWAMMNGKTAVIEDIFADNRIPHEVYRKTFVKSLIMTPVGKEGSVAAIGAYWSEFRAFSEREVAVIVALAASVANAIKGAAAA